MLQKKAIFFSTDAIIAIGIIVFVLLISFPLIEISKPRTEIHRDLLETLSTLKIGEIDNSYVQALIASGEITKTNISLLEQIGEFYVTDINSARTLATEVIKELDIKQNVGIWYENKLIASINSTPYETAENVETARQIISGISDVNGSVTGFSARAFLNSNVQKKFFFFGGYIGDGNLSVEIEYEGNITEAEIEAVINDDFELYVNGFLQGTFSGSLDEFTPMEYILSITDFNSGINTIELRGQKLHVAGGFIKISYESSDTPEFSSKYNFPGVVGLINIYDGLIIPGDINSMSLSLHLDSAFEAFLTIGNTTIFRNTTTGEDTITLSNSTLASLLNYSALASKTVPIRLGLENVSFVTNGTLPDIISVTDLSGSMTSGTPPKVDQAIEANRELVDIVLNQSGSRLGLVGYDDSAREEWFHELSNDSVSLNNKLDDYYTGGGTCICCGINRGTIAFALSPVIQARVLQGSDDAEQRVSNGAMTLTSTDLEMIQETAAQIVGLRFQGINIPQGSIINSAYIEFETDETNTGATHLTFFAEDIDNAPTFTSTNNHIGNRQKTQASATWSSVPAWNTISEKHQTPDIAPLIQEVVDRAGWLSGNSIAIIINGTGKRVAESYDGESENAPLLVIDYQDPNCGNSVIDVGEQCDDGNTNSNDGCSSICKDENKYRSMIVMSDGQANQECSEQNTGTAIGDAIQAACDAYEDYGIIVNAIGFGSGADEAALQQIAQCGNGDYYFSDVNELINVYSQLAQSILEAAFTEQTIETSANVTTILYPDSYIEYDYQRPALPYGLYIITEKKFDYASSGNFSVPNDAVIVSANAISYSGPKWTDKVKINSNIVYQLIDYGQEYTSLGDPYAISIPTNQIIENNTVEISIATSPLNSTVGSANNMIIYTIAKNASTYSDIAPNIQGCNWIIEFEDNTNVSLLIPSNYTGSNSCVYSSIQQDYDNNDATQGAVQNLLEILDINKNNKIETKFSEQDLKIELTEITGIPYTWSTEVQIRRWY